MSGSSYELAVASQFRALITGTIAGALMRAEHLVIDVEILVDDHGDYRPELIIVGRQSGTRLRVLVQLDEGVEGI